MKIGFLTRITYSSKLWISGLLLLLVSVVVSYLSVPKVIVQPVTPSELTLLPGCGGMAIWLLSFFRNPYVQYGFSLLVIIGIAILLQYLTSDNRLIRIRSFFPFFMFCVLASTLFPYITPPRSLVSCLFLTWACHRIFSVNEKKELKREIFDASLLVAMATLTMSRLVWLLPFLWFAAGIIQPFSFRNLCSSLIGFITIYWIIGGLSFLFNDYRYLVNWYNEVFDFKLLDFSTLSFVAITYLCFLAFLMLISVGSFFGQLHQDKLRTRNNMYGVLVLWCGLFVLWLTEPIGNTGFLMVLLCPSTLYFSHYFSLKDTLFSRILFFMLLLLAPIVFFFYK